MCVACDAFAGLARRATSSPGSRRCNLAAARTADAGRVDATVKMDLANAAVLDSRQRCRGFDLLARVRCRLPTAAAAGHITTHWNGPAGRNGPCDSRDGRAPGRPSM